MTKVIACTPNPQRLTRFKQWKDPARVRTAIILNYVLNNKIKQQQPAILNEVLLETAPVPSANTLILNCRTAVER
jgi:hypothetical protein